ncbi:MAG: CBS domain-containing protein [Candidatus Thermoplasmatota archaeon]|nr:CBS domain-containing protein [Candidatus Thermoplasmatota archaeon]
MICKNCGQNFEIRCPSCGVILVPKISEIKVDKLMVKDVISVGPKTPVRDVMKTIKEKDLNALPVVDKEKNLVGIIAQKDLLFRDEWFDALWGSTYASNMFIDAVLRRMSSTVDKLMVKDVITVEKDDPLCKAAELMIKKRKDQLPVVEKGKLVGIISRKDIVKLVMSGCDEA